MSYLLDTNIWLERLLHQEKSEDVGRLLQLLPSDSIYITDFAFHTISLILTRLKQNKALLQFINDAFIYGDVHIVRLFPDDTKMIIHAINESALDYDDAYQYTAAEKYDLVLVSFDDDFDRTLKGRKTPADILRNLKS